jgi:hypothetical protein
MNKRKIKKKKETEGKQLDIHNNMVIWINVQTLLFHFSKDHLFFVLRLKC